MFNPAGKTGPRSIGGRNDGVSTMFNPTGKTDPRTVFETMNNPLEMMDSRPIGTQANREIQGNEKANTHSLQNILSDIKEIATEHKSDNEFFKSVLAECEKKNGFLDWIENAVSDIKNGKGGYIKNYEWPLESIVSLAGKLRSEVPETIATDVKLKLESLADKLSKVVQDTSDFIEAFNSRRFSTQLEEIADSCEMRALEIRTVFESITKGNGGVGHHAEGGNDVDSKTFAELVGESVPDMPIYKELVERYAERLSVPLSRLEEIENSVSDKVYNLDEINTIERELTTLHDDLSEIIASKKVILKDGTTAVLDQEMLSLLKAKLEDTTNRFEKFHNFFRKDFLAKTLSSAAEGVFSQMAYEQKLLNDNTFKRMFPNLVRYGELSNEYNSLKDKVLDNSSEDIDKIKGIIQETFDLANSTACDDERNKFDELCREIKTYKESRSFVKGGLLETSGLDLQDYQNAVEFMDSVLMFELTLHNSGYDDRGFIDNSLVGRNNNHEAYFCTKLLGTIDRIRNYQAHSEQYRTGEIFAKAMKNNAPLSTIIEAQLHGATLDMIDSVCDDSNLVNSPNSLGNGQFNSVKLCSFMDEKSGKIVEKVFKDEDSGYLDTIHRAQTGVIGLSSQQLAHLNIATEKCANMISNESLYVKTNVGMLNGVYGMFMDKATGSAPENVVFPKNADKKTQCEVRGEVMRQTSTMQLIDLLTDQVDRHSRNYFVDISNDSADNQFGVQNVKITAFDNDLSFTANRPGLYDIKMHKVLKGNQLPGVLADMRIGVDTETFISELVEKGAAKENEDGSVTFNLPKLTTKERAVVARVLGYQSFKIPDYMDEDCYNHIIALKNNDAVRNELMASLPVDITAEAKQCFVTRLDDMIKLAEQYKKEGKVLSKAQWYDENVQFDMYNNCISVPTDSMVPGSDADFASEKFCEQYYDNDLFFRDLAYICMDDDFQKAAIEHKREQFDVRFEPMDALQQDVRIADQAQASEMDVAQLRNSLRSFSWNGLQNALDKSHIDLSDKQKDALQKLFTEMEDKMRLLADANASSPVSVYQDAKVAMEKLSDAISSMRYQQLYDDSLNTSESIAQFRNAHQRTVLDDMRKIKPLNTLKRFLSDESGLRRALREGNMNRSESSQYWGEYNDIRDSWKSLRLHAMNIGYGMQNAETWTLQAYIDNFKDSINKFNYALRLDFYNQEMGDVQNEALELFQNGFIQQVDDISAQRKSLREGIVSMENHWNSLKDGILDLPQASQKRINDRIKQARSLVGDIMTAMEKYDGNIENEKGNSGNPIGIEDKILKKSRCLTR
ncbi:MAG: hypothetical protein MJ202_01975 [Lentisphaeria bacterium]|nr:hypothetical protein [Lentisphaeria bacterium]